VLPAALHAAVWAEDLERVREATRRLDATAESGPLVDAYHAIAHGLVTALEGHTDEALPAIRDALGRLRDLELRWEVARFCLDTLFVLPHDAEVLGWADEARQIFTELRAQPYLDVLDRELAKVPAGAR
jgi:hypothetical protein